MARPAHASAGARGRENGSEDGAEGGFTLVELLVAIGIFAVLSTLVLSGLTATVKTVDDARSITNLN
jgi:prepilin-type N-terminal cleavage/methylation domain-containing protein